MSRALIQTTKALSVMVFAFVMVNCDAGSFIDPVEVEQEPGTIAVDPLPELITEDDTVTFQGQVLDQDGQPVEGAEITWTTSDGRIADVTHATGTEATLIARQPGTTTITATYETLSVSSTVEVHPRPVDLVYVSGSGQAGFSGATLADSLVVRVLDKRGDPVSDVRLQMVATTGGGSVAPETGPTDVDGYFRSAWTLGGAGSQTVEARASEGQARVKAVHDSVVVFTADAAYVLASLEVTPATATLEVGDTLQLDVDATTTDGTHVESPQVGWSSSDTAVATIGTDGVIEARQSGSVQLIAQASSGDPALADTSAVTVMEPAASVTGIEIRPATATVDTGGTQQFDAIAHMSDGTEKVAAVDWTATGGTISSEDLYTAGTTEGTFGVTISHDLGYYDTATVTVFAPEPVVARVTISPATDTIEVSGTSQLTATVLDGDGNTLTDRSVTWSSSDETAASVDGTGLVNGISTGQVTIVATADGVSGNASITVVSTALGAVTISPSADTLYGVGTTLTLMAEARNADGSLISDPEITWTSHNPDIATVDSMGTLTTQALGTVLVTAAALGCSSDSGTFVVEPEVPAQVTDLQVDSVTSSSVALTWTQVDDGTGSPANYAVRTGSPSLSWSSAYDTEVTVDGTAIGESISYTYSELSASTDYEFQLVSYRGTLNEDAVFGSTSNAVSATTGSSSGLSEPVYDAAAHTLVIRDDFDGYANAQAARDAYPGGRNTEFVTLTPDRDGAGHAARLSYGPSHTDDILFGPTGFGPYNHVYFTTWFRALGGSPTANGGGLKGFMFWRANQSGLRYQFGVSRYECQSDGGTYAEARGPGQGDSNRCTGLDAFKTTDGGMQPWPTDGQWHRWTVEIFTTGSGHNGYRYWLDGTLIVDFVDILPAGSYGDGYPDPVDGFHVFGNGWSGDPSQDLTIDFDDWVIWTE